MFVDSTFICLLFEFLLGLLLKVISLVGMDTRSLTISYYIQNALIYNIQNQNVCYLYSHFDQRRTVWKKKYQMSVSPCLFLLQLYVVLHDSITPVYIHCRCTLILDPPLQKEHQQQCLQRYIVLQNEWMSDCCLMPIKHCATLTLIYASLKLTLCCESWTNLFQESKIRVFVNYHWGLQYL